MFIYFEKNAAQNSNGDFSIGMKGTHRAAIIIVVFLKLLVGRYQLIEVGDQSKHDEIYGM